MTANFENNKFLEIRIGKAVCSVREVKDIPNGAERHGLPDSAARRLSAMVCNCFMADVLPLLNTSQVFKKGAKNNANPEEGIAA